MAKNRKQIERIAYHIAEAAEAAGIGPLVIRNAVRCGELPFHKVGVHSLILKIELEKWIAKK